MKMATGGVGSQEIAAALRMAVLDACQEDELTVIAVAELDGAMVQACCVQVCVNTDGTGINVECWHRHGSRPYKQTSVTTLEEAVQLVLAEFDDV